MEKHIFHVSGVHCPSCKILIEDLLNEVETVKGAKLNLKNSIIVIETSFSGNAEQLATILSEKIGKHGYALSVERNTPKMTRNGLWASIFIGLGLLLLFFLLQKSGILNFGFGGKITPITSFLIGLVASVSSCLAVVGGLVLSLSAKISQDDLNDTETFILFHIGRLVSFAILGGLLGAVGGTLALNFTLTAVLGIVASLVVVLLGLNLLGIFEKNKLVLPEGIFNFLKEIQYKKSTPFILGFATFFLPCGFTQSMQISALSSGSFMSGLMLMLAFALGTLPMLALLSFGSASFAHGRNATIFFRSAGIFVTGLGLFGLFTGLAGLGIIPPVFNI